MRDSVRSAFVRFNSPLEGVESFMYCDSEGYVTTGMGNEIDSISQAQSLPWKNPDGSLADAGTVAAQWQTVKNAYPAYQSVACAPLTTIRLDAAGIQLAVERAIAAAEPELRASFPAYDSLPADAQLALLSDAWAMGGAFGQGFPQLRAAVNATPPQFAAAAPLAHFHDNPPAVARMAANDLLWQNAQAVIDHGLNPDVLYWPGKAPTSPSALAFATLFGTGLGAALYVFVPGVRDAVKGWIGL